MPAFAAPLSAEKVAAWEAWADELGGARKAEFEDMNSRHGLEEHRAYLQATPDGGYVVLVVAEGPGAEGFMESVGNSDHEFDRWFRDSVADLHGMDMAGEAPPMGERRI